MYVTFIIDFISVILLGGAFYLIWKERLRFYSLKPLLPAVILLAIGHICDMLIEHPSIQLSIYFGMPIGSLERGTAIVGNIADSCGVAFLIVGFIKIITYEKEEQKRIQELERMLPLCSNCKKYRTEDGTWLPIEVYLHESGAPEITHGMCPDCYELFYGNRTHKKNN